MVRRQMASLAAPQTNNCSYDQLVGWCRWHPRGAGSSPGGREFPMPRGKNPPRWVGQGSGGFSVGVKSRGSRFLLMKCGRGPFQPPIRVFSIDFIVQIE